MRIHRREQAVHAAEHELTRFILDLVKKHELTEGEQLRVVNAAASSYIGGMAKYMIRDERHGDPSKPGGIE